MLVARCHGERHFVVVPDGDLRRLDKIVGIGDSAADTMLDELYVYTLKECRSRFLADCRLQCTHGHDNPGPLDVTDKEFVIRVPQLGNHFCPSV